MHYSLPHLRKLLSTVVLAAVFAATAHAKESPLPTKLQGAYKFTSVTVIINGQKQSGSDSPNIPKNTIQLGSAGLAAPGLVASMMKDLGPIVTLTHISASTTSFSASFTGKSSGDSQKFTAGSSLKVTVSSSGIAMTIKLVGNKNGKAFTGSASAQLKKR